MHPETRHSCLGLVPSLQFCQGISQAKRCQELKVDASGAGGRSVAGRWLQWELRRFVAGGSPRLGWRFLGTKILFHLVSVFRPSTISMVFDENGTATRGSHWWHRKHGMNPDYPSTLHKLADHFCEAMVTWPWKSAQTQSFCLTFDAEKQDHGFRVAEDGAMENSWTPALNDKTGETITMLLMIKNLQKSPCKKPSCELAVNQPAFLPAAPASTTWTTRNVCGSGCFSSYRGTPK